MDDRSQGSRPKPSGRASVPDDLNERLALLVEAATEYAIFTLDVDGNVTSWNPGAQRVKGYTADEIIGRHFSNFYTPEDREDGRPDRLLAIAIADGSVEDEGWRVRKDGTRFWADVVITALRGSDGRLRGFGKVTRDLSARKRGEEAMRESEERFRALVESVREYAIFMLDPNGRIVSWNRGAERLKGYRADEIIGQHISRFYTEDDARDGKPARLLAMAAAEGSVEDEAWRVRKDGSRFWANVVITAIRDADGNLKGYAKVTRDLTERKRNEDALRGVLERERLVAERLRAVDRSKDDVLSVVAHDLRTPLGAIRGFAESLDDHWGVMSDEEKLDIVRTIAASANDLGGLVENMMDVTRIDTGDVSFEIGSFDADAFASRVVSEVAGQQAGRVAFERSGTGRTEARGDERRSWQVLANLVSNALRFSPGDKPVRVAVEDKVDSGEVRFVVTDQGPGIPPEDQERIFEKFGKGSSRRRESTGLGLYIARCLAEGQGGRIELQSVVGQGSTFTFVLPRPGAEGRPGDVAAEEPAGEGASVLQLPDRRSSSAPDVQGRRAHGSRH